MNGPDDVAGGGGEFRGGLAHWHKCPFAPPALLWTDLGSLRRQVALCKSLHTSELCVFPYEMGIMPGPPGIGVRIK